VSLEPLGDGEVPYVPFDLKQKFKENTVRLRGDHLRWTGSFSSRSRTPFMYFENRQVPAAAVAFVLRTGRWPVGYVRRMCDVAGCVGLRCVEDQVGRARLDEQLVAMGLRKRRRYGTASRDDRTENA
jgi:hypothetical protein